MEMNVLNNLMSPRSIVLKNIELSISKRSNSLSNLLGNRQEVREVIVGNVGQELAMSLRDDELWGPS